MATILDAPPSELASSFETWEQAFRIRPCIVRALTESGISKCGHDATVQAHLKCKGCGEDQPDAFLCGFHLGAAILKRLALHPRCGLIGLTAEVVEITRL